MKMTAPDVAANETEKVEAGMSSDKHRKPEVWRRLDVLSASISLNLLSLALPLFILQVYDRIIPYQADTTFIVLIIGVAVALGVEALLRILRASVMAWEAARYDHTETRRAIQHLMQVDARELESHSAGFFLDRLQSLGKIQNFYAGQSVTLIVDLPFVAIFMFVIAYLVGILVLVPLLLIMILALVCGFGSHHVHKAVAVRSDMEARRQNFLMEVLQAMHSVKAMAMEKPILRRYERLQGQSAEISHDLAKANTEVESAGISISQLGIVIFVAMGAVQVIGGHLSLGALAAATLLSGRALQPAVRAMGIWSQFQAIKLAKHQADELYALRKEPEGKLVPLVCTGKIELDAVCFSYPGSDKLIADRLTLNIEPGEAVAITGPNGTGKSTLLKIMAGILAPTRGRMLLDDNPIDSYKRDFVHQHIAVVPQKGVLFEGTLLENMTLFRGEEYIEQALELAYHLGLYEIVVRLPMGLDTRISGTNLNTLPEGVKQKIVIIRSLLGNPGVILFDDSNANLDFQNDYRLLRLIRRYKGSKTMVIATHRPAYMRLCDRQLLLRDATVTDISSHFSNRSANITSFTR